MRGGAGRDGTRRGGAAGFAVGPCGRQPGVLRVWCQLDVARCVVPARAVLSMDSWAAAQRAASAAASRIAVPRCLQMQQMSSGSGRGSREEGSSRQSKPAANEFWWDLAGWVCLTGLVVGYIALARGTAQAAPTAG